jgi:hypothetical protein
MSEVEPLWYELEPPPEVRWHDADLDEYQRALRVPRWSLGRERMEVEFNNEEAFSERDGEYHQAAVKVGCPGCRRTCQPLMSERTAHLHDGWRWAGLSYREPFSEFLCTCPGCGRDYILICHSPQ